MRTRALGANGMTMLEEPDYFARELEELHALDLSAPDTNGTPADVIEDLDEWQRVDLGPAVRGELPDILPDLGRRDDGQRMLYRGHVNGIHADSGVGKGWVAAIVAVQELNAGMRVAWVSFEDPDERLVVTRLLELGAQPDDVERLLHYYAPPSTPFTADAVELVAKAARVHGITLIVIDSVGEAFGLEGINEDKDAEVGPWLRRVARPLADTGAAVLLIDHATKAKDNPLYPSGSKRKRAAITGASYLLESPQPLTRERGGRLTLTCAKDRHGHYRRGEVVAEVVFTVYPDDGMTVHVWAPDPADQTKSASDALSLKLQRAAVQAAKDAGEALSQRRLLQRMKDAGAKGGVEAKRAAIEEAIADGAIRTEQGPQRRLLHVYVRDLTVDTEDAEQ
jgi:KaiC/GvpD/RAD55 family RecA-like ATPase